MIPIIVRERHRQQQEARGWALMELFFLGAVILYLTVSPSHLIPVIAVSAANRLRRPRAERLPRKI